MISLCDVRTFNSYRAVDHVPAECDVLSGLEKINKSVRFGGLILMLHGNSRAIEEHHP
jgi:hypothetical protein